MSKKPTTVGEFADWFCGDETAILLNAINKRRGANKTFKQHVAWEKRKRYPRKLEALRLTDPITGEKI